MATAAQRVGTFEELYEAIKALPEGITGEVLSDGVIETMGRPARPHRRVAKRLGALLWAEEDDAAPSGWVVEPEAEVLIALGRLVVPDLAGWRIVEGDTDFLDANPILRRPDWVCEILSESTASKDRGPKMALYSRAGVPHIWIVDPGVRTVEVYTPRKGEAARIAAAKHDESARLPPFDLDVDLSRLWGPHG
jgi:Uma2 family endonuclease